MGTYRVYNENYSGYGVEDLSSIDFVEVDNAVLICVKTDNTIPVLTACVANENYCDNSQYLTSGICTPSFFDDKPSDIQIDADSIFTSQPKPDVVDNSDLLNISSDTSTLMQGSCLDLFNNKADKFEDFKI